MAGEMAQWVGMPALLQDLSLNYHRTHKKHNKVMHACNLSAGAQSLQCEDSSGCTAQSSHPDAQ